MVCEFRAVFGLSFIRLDRFRCIGKCFHPNPFVLEATVKLQLTGQDWAELAAADGAA